MGLEEDRRQDSARLKAVEEAVIEFRTIAKTIVVDHAKRLDEHDNDIDNLKIAIYQSCDAKTTEFDTKTEKMKNNLLKVIGIATGLGLTAVIYFNSHTSTIESNISAINVKLDYIIKKDK